MRHAVLVAALMSCTPGAQPMRPPIPYAGVAGPLVIGHRGGSLEVPENTLAALKYAVEIGTDWQELDVTLSSDDAVIVIHDDTLERTTNGQGLATLLPLTELRKLAAGRPRWSEESLAQLAMFGVTPPDFGDRYAAERIPTLDEVLAIPGSRLMIEMKQIEPKRVAKLVDRVITLVHRAQAADRVILGSFETDLLLAASQRDPSIALIGITETSDGIRTMLDLPVQALGVRMDLIRDAVERAPANIAVWGWTAWSVPMATAAVEQGAHGVITDVPRAVLAALRPRSGHLVELP